MTDQLLVIAKFTLGAVVGYLSGMLGVGGGFMMTPLLHVFFGIPVNTAVGSALAQMIAVGAIGTIQHARAGHVDVRISGLLSPGILSGLLFGAAALQWLTRMGTVNIGGRSMPLINPVINGIFLVILLSMSIRMWWDKSKGEDEDAAGSWCWQNGPWRVSLPCVGGKHCSMVTVTACGLVIGVASGLLGIGGGVLLIPILTRGFGVNLRSATGTSLLLVLISASFGTILHYTGGCVDLKLAAVLAAGSIIGVTIGTRHSLSVSTVFLTKAFAVLLVIVAGIIAARLFS